jgi:hypothetical protein
VLRVLVACLCLDTRAGLAGSLGAPLKTGLYVQRSVVERLYAASAIHDPGSDPRIPCVVAPESAVLCSPALASYLGMRDPEAARVVNFTVHAGDRKAAKCVMGDSCRGQIDAISHLTHAMSDDLFHVEFHSATAVAKGFDAFVQEVCIPGSNAPFGPRSPGIPSALHHLRLLVVQKLKTSDPVIVVLEAPHPWIDRHVARSIAAAASP